MPTKRLALLLMILLSASIQQSTSYANMTIYSETETDIVTKPIASIHTSPPYATSIGQTIVTVSVRNVDHFYGWQLTFDSSAVINVTYTRIPATNIFQGYESLGLWIINGTDETTFVNSLIGRTEGVNGDGILLEAVFEVHTLPAIFGIDKENTILVNSSAQAIPYIYIGNLVV